MTGNHCVPAKSKRDLTAKSDGELLASFRDHNDEDAFREVVERHKAMVSSVCTSVLGNHADAEDAFQAAFFILARKSQRIEQKESVGGWLHRVALRCALTSRRRKSNRDDVVMQAQDGPKQQQLERISTRATYAALHEALDAMPEKHRLPLILCYIEGLSCQDAARRLKLGEGAMYKRLERGRQALRRRLSAIGLGGLPLLLFSCGAAFAQSTTISSAKVGATVFVAMQARHAWAQGALACAGKQASLSLAQGVLKTMMMTSILKSACSIVVGACAGLAMFSAVAIAQEPQRNDAEQIRTALRVAAETAQQDKDDDQAVVRTHVQRSGDTTGRSVTVTTTRNFARFTPSQVTKQPLTVTTTRNFARFTPWQVATEPLTVTTTRNFARFTPSQVTTQPLTVTTARNFARFTPRVVDSQLVIEDRLERIESRIEQLSAQIDMLQRLMEDK